MIRDMAGNGNSKKTWPADWCCGKRYQDGFCGCTPLVHTVRQRVGGVSRVIGVSGVDKTQNMLLLLHSTWVPLRGCAIRLEEFGALSIFGTYQRVWDVFSSVFSLRAPRLYPTVPTSKRFGWDTESPFARTQSHLHNNNRAVRPSGDLDQHPMAAAAPVR